MSLPAKLTVTSTFGIYPALGGGQLRLLHICRRLAQRFPVDVVALVADDEPALTRNLAPGLREIRVPMSRAHAQREAELGRDAGVPVTDVAFPQLHELTPAFTEAVGGSLVVGGAVMASHPYTLPVIEAVEGTRRLWYDVQDVAADLKASVLAPNDTGTRLLKSTQEVERACCQRAELVLATSADDRDRLRELYGVADERLAIVANGVEVSAVAFTDPAARRRRRAALGMERPLALFVGSWHPPNLKAVARIVDLAAAREDVDFVIAGSVCRAFEDVAIPSNLQLLGVIDEGLKLTLLSVASVALNPMTTGSGTNLKMLDYLAAGVPVISTRVGARGLELDPARHLRVTSPAGFGAAISELIGEPDAEATRRAVAARAHVEEGFDWGRVVDHLVSVVEGLPAPAQPLSATRATTA